MRVLAAMVAGSATALAASPTTGPAPGNFETYTFALQYTPEFVQGYCTGAVPPNIPGSYAETHLTVHGLWPNYDSSKHSGHTWPQWCKRTDADFTKCQSAPSGPSYCSPSASTLAKFNTSSAWQTYALEYAFSDSLAAHEWSKHGGCTLWDQSQYFTQIATLHAHVSQMTGFKLVTTNHGKSVNPDDLRTAFASDLGGTKAALKCTSCKLSEVWIGYEATPSTYDVDTTKPSDVSAQDTCTSCKTIDIIGYSGCPAPAPGPSPGPGPSPSPSPADKCVRGQRGPVCTYNASSAGGNDDPCKKYSGCVRCPKAAHSGVHYCTSELLRK
eukprot:TRINITY_DN2210_c5_g1_i1.p1 TRINITY_DN2210_c5_g1~~TRINITY_DN2210_c5_g1_i1.p1  ORF type:complete len:327 (+),score=48.14 TRINITY_DN2210_c5_g1_i1:91-1071(+)